MSEDWELQRGVTRVALEALAGRDFALAGSGAIREHGIVDRPTQDVDLFTSDMDAAAFESSIGVLLTELRRTGHDVDEVRRSPQFAQLRVTTPDGQSIDMDLAVDWREREPAQLSVGPVLSLEDAVGSKVNALYTRAEARDFLDVDAIRASGHFTDRDAGFDLAMFAKQLDVAQRLAPSRVERYGVDADQLDAMKGRFQAWAAEIRTPAAAVDEQAATRGRGVDEHHERPASSNMAAAREAAARQRRDAADRTGRVRPASPSRPPADRGPGRGAERD